MSIHVYNTFIALSFKIFIYISGASLGGLAVKNLPANTGDPGSIPGSGRSSGKGNGNPFLCSCLENPMNRIAWWAIVQGATKPSNTT